MCQRVAPNLFGLRSLSALRAKRAAAPPAPGKHIGGSNSVLQDEFAFWGCPDLLDVVDKRYFCANVELCFVGERADEAGSKVSQIR